MTINRLLRKPLSVLLIAVMLATFPVAGAASSGATGFTDLPEQGHWSYAGIISVIENGIMEGSGGGEFQPDRIITLAEASAFLARAMGAHEGAEDIPGLAEYDSDSWYGRQGVIGIAYRMGILDGIIASYGVVTPGTPLVCEDAFDMMARAIKAGSGDLSSLEQFTDGGDVSPEYALNIAALIELGYVNGHGNADGTRSLEPQQTITRARFATVFGRVFQQYISEAGEYGQNSIFGSNILINAPGVILKDLKIAGDLYIGEGIGTDVNAVILDNVQIDGRLVNRSSSEGSVVILDSGGDDNGNDNDSDNDSDNGNGGNDRGDSSSGSGSSGSSGSGGSSGASSAYDGSLLFGYLKGTGRDNATNTPNALFAVDRPFQTERTLSLSGSLGTAGGEIYILAWSAGGYWAARALSGHSTVAGYTLESGYLAQPSDATFRSITLSGGHDGPGTATVREYANEGMGIVLVGDATSGAVYLGMNGEIAGQVTRGQLIVMVIDPEGRAVAAFVFNEEADRGYVAGLTP